MTYSATAFKIMIASPGDVDSERGLVRRILQQWNDVNSEDKKAILMPIGWDTHSAPSMAGSAQSIINKQVLKDCDLLIAVFWTRLGTPTDDSLSGTVEEIERHIDAGKPTMIYFSNSPVHPDSVNPDQYKALKLFKEKCETTGLIETYESLDDFQEKFNRQLSITMIKELLPINKKINGANIQGEIESPIYSPISKLTEEAKKLLVATSKDKNGVILHIRTFSGLSIQTGNINFVDEGNPRSEALWEKALQLLINEGLIVDQSYKGEVFRLTSDGYEAADLLSTTT
jgi:hypothetical protein